MARKNLTAVDQLIETARHDAAKGNYQVYQAYRRQLESMSLTPIGYQVAVKRLADALRV